MEQELPPAFHVLWAIGVGLTFVVFIPLAVYLLHSTMRIARSIRRYAAEALVAAGGIAANTPHVAALDTTIDVASGVLAAAGEVDQKLGTIADVLAARAR